MLILLIDKKHNLYKSTYLCGLCGKYIKNKKYEKKYCNSFLPCVVYNHSNGKQDTAEKQVLTTYTIQKFFSFCLKLLHFEKRRLSL